MKNGFMSADDESSTSDAKEDEELEKLRQVARRKYELENQFSSEEESLASQEVEEMQPSRELEVKEMQSGGGADGDQSGGGADAGQSRGGGGRHIKVVFLVHKSEYQ